MIKFCLTARVNENLFGFYLNSAQSTELIYLIYLDHELDTLMVASNELTNEIDKSLLNVVNACMHLWYTFFL